MTPVDQPHQSERSRKILEQEERHLSATLEQLRPGLDGPARVLEAACTLMNQRSRYFGAAGEHFSVQDIDGILLIDALDERLLKAMRELLHGWIRAKKRTPDLALLQSVTQRLSTRLRPLSDRPVGFEVLYVVRESFSGFETLLEEETTKSQPALEHALVHHLLGVIDKYVQSREKPVVRHFSDVAREYSVVSRLKCACGEEKYEVKMQALCQSPDGSPYDRMELQCRACGVQRSLSFDLPHFRDMYQIS